MKFFRKRLPKRRFMVVLQRHSRRCSIDLRAFNYDDAIARAHETKSRALWLVESVTETY